MAHVAGGGNPPQSLRFLPRQAKGRKKMPSRTLASCLAAHPMLSCPAVGGRVPHAAFQSAIRLAPVRERGQSVLRHARRRSRRRADRSGPQGRQERLQPVGRGLRAQASPRQPFRQRQGCRSLGRDQGSGKADRQGEAPALRRPRHRCRRDARRDGACRAGRGRRRSRLERSAIPQFQDSPDRGLGDDDAHRDAEPRRSHHHRRQRHSPAASPLLRADRVSARFDVRRHRAEAHGRVYRQGARPFRRQGLAHRRGRHAWLQGRGGGPRRGAASGRACAAFASRRQRISA